MNPIKETNIKRECFRAAAEIYAVLLRNRNATRVDYDLTIPEIYHLALVLYKNGKKRYWSTGDEDELVKDIK
jgi:hypothetical protein